MSLDPLLPHSILSKLKNLCGGRVKNSEKLKQPTIILMVGLFYIKVLGQAFFKRLVGLRGDALIARRNGRKTLFVKRFLEGYRLATARRGEPFSSKKGSFEKICA